MYFGLHKSPIRIDLEGRPRDGLGNHAAHTIGGQYVNEKNKGERLGSCNVASCQRPWAIGLHSNGKWYCADCTRRINQANSREDRSVWTPIKIDEEAELIWMDNV